MNIIIAGSGKVGSMLAFQLCSEGHDVTIIDSNAKVLQNSVERYDVMGVHGNCASMGVLQQANVMGTDLLIAATSHDEVNLLCCTTAHALNQKLHTIARIRDPEYTEQIYRMRNIFGLSMVINPENQAATEIERLLKYPGFLRRDTFAKGRTEIVELRVDENSPLCNIKLMDLRSVVKCQVLVCAVIRNGSSVAPKGDFVLRQGDRLFVTALTQNLTTLLKNLGLITRRVRNVTICGGGKISYYLAKRLEKSGIDFHIVEKDLGRCQELCEQLPGATIIHGDISDQEMLEDSSFTSSDALVTLTGLDELNSIVSLYGTSRQIPHVITKLSHTRNRGVLNNLDLGSVICPRELICNNIVRYVRAMENQTGAAMTVHAIADGQAEAMEFLVDSHTQNCGKPLKEIRLKPNVLLVSVSHGASTEIANGDSSFGIGDMVLVVVGGGAVIRQLNDIFA